MTAAVFELMFNKLMAVEGGYVNNPDDKGGATKYGVSQRAYPDLDIKNLTLDDAKFIFQKDYWDRVKADYLPDALSIIVSDTAYHSNHIRAIKILQKSLGVKVDGKIGNETLGAANRLPVRQTLDAYIENRFTYLRGLKSWSKFGKGWTNRVNAIAELAWEYV